MAEPAQAEALVPDSLDSGLAPATGVSTAEEKAPSATNSGTPSAGESETSLTAQTAGDAPAVTGKKEDPKPPRTSAWQYKPVPPGPDRHEEFEGRAARGPSGFTAAGGRVRGKMHKHNGTNCDDWFEFRHHGPWTVAAVSDGAGAYKFSRIGARLASTTFVEQLGAALNEPALETWRLRVARATKAELGPLAEELRRLAGSLMQQAMRAALAAVLHRVAEINATLSYHQEKSDAAAQPLTLRDFYATLLVSLHLPILVEGRTYSFILAASCGDGMIGVVHRSPEARADCTLLMSPDAGEFSGQTDFLTEKSLTDQAFGARLHAGVFGGLQALMLMTDGVADDYFPNNPGLLELHADLLLNRILPAAAPAEIPASFLQEELAALKATAEPRPEDSHRVVDRLLPGETRSVRVASLDEWAKKLGVEAGVIAANSRLVAALAATAADPAPELTAPEDRLVHWLDAYTVRGSFDDRTLVVISPTP
jgi:hypothetical protein